jgi:hypothetical protein
MRDFAERSRVHLEEFGWTCGIRYSKMVNLGKDISDSMEMEEDEDRKVWETDPVQPCPLAYTSITEANTFHPKGLHGT